MRVPMSLSLLFSLVALIATPEPVFAEGGTSVGGGGNEVALDVQASASAAILDIQKSPVAGFAELNLNALSDLARSAKFVERRNSLFVEFEGKRQEVVARNFPEQGLIEINRWRWMSIQDPAAKKALALHEVLSLQRLESTGAYPFSSAYLAAVSANGRVVAEFPVDPDEIVPIDVGRPVTVSEVSHAKVVCSVPEASGTHDIHDAHRLAQSIAGQVYSAAFGTLPTYWTARYGFGTDSKALIMRVETHSSSGRWYSTARKGVSLQFLRERDTQGMFKVILTPRGGTETTLVPASRIPYLEYDYVSVPSTQFDSWGNPLDEPNHMATNLRLIQKAGQLERVPLINARSGRAAPGHMAIDVKKYTACLIGVLKTGR